MFSWFLFSGVIDALQSIKGAPMKPRICYSRGLFYCRIPAMDGSKYMGIGNTPLQAYDDWLSMRTKKELEECA